MIEKIGLGKPIKGAPIGGNSENVVNPRNTLNEEHIIKNDNAGRWNYDYIMKNNLWRNEV